MTQTATFAAGCFWGVQALFDQTPGVVETTVGYTGGTVDHPTYQQVCTDRTGHAEAVELRFDPARVSYEKLLDLFWKLHDPTTPNRQGPDIGTQYRSAIFTHSPEQQAAAVRSRDAFQRALRRPIVTEIGPAGTFWAAEDYHQKYYQTHHIACHLPA